MASYSVQVNDALDTVNKTMVQLRNSMRGIQIRTAGFKRLHDDFARDVAKVSVHAAEFLPAMMPK